MAGIYIRKGIEMENQKTAGECLEFIRKSPTCFHVTENIRVELEKAGFCELKETHVWETERGKGYYVIRNGSSLIAFVLPSGGPDGFHIIASHSDSPCFKIKENPQMKAEGGFTKLNVEKYGGLLLSSWLDRSLSVAGRVVVKENGSFVSRLVNVDKDLLVIPNVAVHMNREINKGVEYNPQTDMPPLFGGGFTEGEFERLIAESAGVKPREVLGSDLYLYVRGAGVLTGVAEEFMLSPRLDDQECVFASMKGFLQAEPEKKIAMLAVFDNEEVGSLTRQGAASTFLRDTLENITQSDAALRGSLRRLIAGSFLISADNAHGVHPNHPEKADPVNRPVLNGGIVIKHHGGQKYTTDAYTAAVVRDLCARAGVPWQTYTNRSDIPGGSTLGNLSAAQAPLPGADIGLAQLAMHSAAETAGAADVDYLFRAAKEFYGE